MAVHKAMIRAGRLMHRVMCKFTDNQTVMGWDRWQEVEGDQKRAAAIMLRCLNHIEHQYEAEGYSAWLELVAESRELERSRSAEENAEARIRALEQAHALEIAKRDQAEEEAKRNTATLKAFYQKHSPDRKVDHLQVLEAYSLEQIVGLAMMRYGEAPEFYSGGKLVKGHITDELAKSQQERRKAEEAKEQARQQEAAQMSCGGVT